MLLFTHIASLPPGTVVYDWPGALFRIEPKLVRAQTYPDGTFLVWKETIPRILDIPSCKYPLGNKIPHIEEQSDIYIKLITARQKKFHSIASTFLQGIYVYFFLAGQSTIFWVSWAAFSYNSGIRPFLKGQGRGDLKKKIKGGEKERGWLVYPSLHALLRFASLLP